MFLNLSPRKTQPHERAATAAGEPIAANADFDSQPALEPASPQCSLAAVGQKQCIAERTQCAP